MIKLGLRVFAFDEELNPLWVYKIPAKWKEYGSHTSYIPAVGDVDGDGKDEVTGGYYLLDDDGSVLWEKKLGPHMDSVAIRRWRRGRRVIASGGGHVLTADGRVVLRLGTERVPHGQELRVADFLGERKGPEMMLRYDAHTTGVITVANTGEVVEEFELNETANNTGMTPVYFHGPEEPAVLCNGGALWTGDGRKVGRLPELPPASRPVEPKERPGWRMAWYHCIPANLAGDAAEEVVLYNPWDTRIYVYANGPPDADAYKGYHPGPRQWNPRLMD